MRFLVAFVLLLVPALASLLAQDADPIRGQLTKAVRDYRAIVANAKLIGKWEFDARIKAMGATGSVEAEKKAFETAAAIPLWLAATPAFKGYPEIIAEADARLEAAYNDAETAYAKALKLDEAKAVRAERLQARLPSGRTAPGVPQAALTATPQPVTPGRIAPVVTIDLMPLIDVEKDSVKGRWVRDGNNLLSDQNKGSVVRIRFEPPEEYDFVMEFTRNEGNDAIAQVCWGYGHLFRWVLAGWYNKFFGIDDVDHRMANGNATSVKMGLENDRRYKSVVKVRKNQISCYLDDRLITSLQTDYSNLSERQWGIEPGMLGVMSWSSSYTIHNLAITEVTGKGKKLHSTDRSDGGRTFNTPRP